MANLITASFNGLNNGDLPTILTTYTDAFADFAADYGMCQWVLDTTRNRVIRIGRKLLAWDLDTEGPWIDISPVDWGYGFGDTKGFYYAPHDRVYFKGPALNSGGGSTSTSSAASEIRFVELS